MREREKEERIGGEKEEGMKRVVSFIMLLAMVLMLSAPCVAFASETEETDYYYYRCNNGDGGRLMEYDHAFGSGFCQVMTLYSYCTVYRNNVRTTMTNRHYHQHLRYHSLCSASNQDLCSHVGNHDAYYQ